MLTYGIYKNGTDEPICKAEVETQTREQTVDTGRDDSRE